MNKEHVPLCASLYDGEKNAYPTTLRTHFEIREEILSDILM